MDTLERSILEKENKSYGVFTHSKVGGAGGVERRKSRTDVVRWIKGDRFSTYGMEFEFWSEGDAERDDLTNI